MFFFFKQNTAYEMLWSLVGSELCIRDSPGTAEYIEKMLKIQSRRRLSRSQLETLAIVCLLYTSEAAEELHCVDLGGRRYIKKKNTN